jgi:hypothetical protein
LKRRTAALVLGIAASTHGAYADPALDIGKTEGAIWSCQTQSVTVAPTAATTNGTFRLRIVGQALAATRWTILDVDPQHTASFAAPQSACRTDCEATREPQTPTVVTLWSPKRSAPASLPAGEALTVATVDTATGKLRASTIIDNAIAALEQGTCERLAP